MQLQKENLRIKLKEKEKNIRCKEMKEISETRKRKFKCGRMKNEEYEKMKDFAVMFRRCELGESTSMPNNFSNVDT
jgi:hypothetical protein